MTIMPCKLKFAVGTVNLPSDRAETPLLVRWRQKLAVWKIIPVPEA
jgi:hypothetical protein